MLNKERKRFYIINSNPPKVTKETKDVIRQDDINEKAVTVYDSLAKKIVNNVNIDSLRQIVGDDIDIDKKTFVKDNIAIADTFGTLVFVNKKHGFYGVIVNYKSYAIVKWIRIKDFNNDAYKMYIGNKYGELVDIEAEGESALRLKSKSLRSECVGTVEGMRAFSSRISMNDFKYIVGFSKIDGIDYTKAKEYLKAVDGIEIEDDEQCNNSSPTTVDNSNQKDIIDDTKNNIASANENNQSNTNNERVNEIEENGHSEVKAETDSENKDGNGKEASEAIISVDNIYKDVVDTDVNDVNMESASDIIYDAMIRFMSKYDTLTLPISYCSRLHILMRKMIESNVTCTNYTGIVDIKFDREGSLNIGALININEQLGKARLTVLKPFNNVKLTEEQIYEIYSQYEKIRTRGAYTKVGE